ncbi:MULTISPECIES: polysaccharide deacetylase family protein [unclassified Sphingomonas]|uniref:polysaccharide deacetylase family protein n=1 Tax=unclassified Sphingomonas TaxID=196159 RepID=UPI000B1CE6F4|nr:MULTISPECIES: polysaccharide deacetylase family protein [unclassified Sphingomonas]
MTRPGTTPPRRLLASIHDVSPRHEPAIDRLLEELASVGVARPAMLVVPDFWREAEIRPGSPFAARLRRWADDGIEMFLHGYSHRDETEHDSWQDRVKASRMTAGEGEFLGLDAGEAERRIHAGRTLIEDIIGRPIAGFIAPAWLYGNGAHAAMKTLGIPLAEDHMRVWAPETGRIFVNSPVITWATRTRARMLSSLAVASVARVIPLPRIVRVGVHPGDVTVPATLSSIRRTVAKIARSHLPSHYRDMVEDLACAS